LEIITINEQNCSTWSTQISPVLILVIMARMHHSIKQAINRSIELFDLHASLKKNSRLIHMSSPLGKWLSRIKRPVFPQQYTRIIQRAQTVLEVNEVVVDFDKHNSGPPNPVFLCAAAKAVLTTKDCTPIVAARLLNRIPASSIDRATHRVAVLVLNKAAQMRDGDAAQLAFARLEQSEPRDVVALVEAKCDGDVSMRVALQDLLTQSDCGTDPRLLSWALKKASGFMDTDLLEKVWKWSTSLREHMQQQNTPDNHIALQYVQYIVAMSQRGHLDKALLAWKEWKQSPLGKSEGVGSSDVLRSAMIAAAASHGDAETAEELYHSRPTSDTNPTPGFVENNGMLLSLLTAYAHAGVPDKAVKQLRIAENAGSVNIREYTAVVDACARVGDFEQAQVIIDGMRSKGGMPDVIMWMTLLGPCRRYRNVSVAQHVFKNVLKTGDHDQKAAAYVVLADVYNAIGRQDHADELHQLRLTLGLQKQRGAVDVIVKSKVWTFHVGEIPSELAEFVPAIEAKLDEWARILSVQGVSTESILCRHSEKLALAFAIVSGQKDITLKKNLRVCSACHNASVALTVTEGIVIRHQDRSRVHVMKNGACSCEGRY
jgi:pentatricopeptide repeat protein